MKIVFAGATGRTGSSLAKSILQERDLEIVAAVGPRHHGQDLRHLLGVTGSPIPIEKDVTECLSRYQPDLLVDFTIPEAAGHHACSAIEMGISPVIGTSGIPAAERARMADACRRHRVGGALIANFSLGAYLLQRFSEQAATLFADAEIIERFHPGKKDKPSGTSMNLQRLLETKIGQVDVHALRLQGSAAHVEVIFGANGETLTIRHDALGGQAYTAGLLRVLRSVRNMKELHTDLGDFL